MLLNGVCPVDLVDAELCRQLPLDRNDVYNMRVVTRLSRSVYYSIAIWAFAFRMWCGTGYFIPWDLVAAAVAINRECFQGIPVLIDDQRTALGRGELCVRYGGAEASLTLLVRIVNTAAVRSALFEALGRLANQSPYRVRSPARLS